MKIAKEPIRLETPVGDEEDSHPGDLIERLNVAKRSLQKTKPFFMQHLF